MRLARDTEAPTAEEGLHLWRYMDMPNIGLDPTALRRHTAGIWDDVNHHALAAAGH